MTDHSKALRDFASQDKKTFNTMLGLYDDKEYKKALEKAEMVLAKYPDHVETSAFKALILDQLKRKTEAYDLIKQALFKNMSNFTCWHVYGMLNRANKKYDDARKAYLQALKIDESNTNVLRDLCTLQLQLKDFKGHCETRRRIVVVNSKQFFNFTGYITAAFLIKNYDLCCEIWESIVEIYGTDPRDTQSISELNEAFLLRAKIYEEMKDAKKGVKFVIKNTKYIVDDVRRNELLVRLYL
jgi:tetratricopeptide (TPR) repeat protein